MKENTMTKIKVKVAIEEVCRRLCPIHRGEVCKDFYDALKETWAGSGLPESFTFELGEIGSIPISEPLRTSTQNPDVEKYY